MRICILAQYFTPIKAAPSRRAERFVKMLRRRHHVTVLTGMPSYPTGKLSKKYRGRAYRFERIGGIGVHRTYELPVVNTGFAKRILNFLSFGISSVLYCGKIGPQDIIVASSPPPTVLISGYLISRIIRAQFVVDARDLWPRSAVELGYFPDSAAVRWIDRVVLKLYKKSDAVICVSSGMKKELVRLGVKAARIHVIHNTTEIRKASARTKSSNRRPLISFVGNFSKSYDFIALADVARQIKKADFLVVGDGEEKEILDGYLRDQKIKNVKLMSSVSAAEARKIIAHSDLGVLPLRNTKLTGYTLPAKVFEYMAEAVPVAGFCKGELCDILKASGFVAESADANGLTKSVRKALINRQVMRDRGKVGRKLLVDEYSYRKAATEIQNVVDEINS